MEGWDVQLLKSNSLTLLSLEWTMFHITHFYSVKYVAWKFGCVKQISCSCHLPSQGPRPNPLASATYIIGYCANFILEHVQQRVDDFSNTVLAHSLSFLHDQITNAMLFLNAQLCPTGFSLRIYITQYISTKACLGSGWQKPCDQKCQIIAKARPEPPPHTAPLINLRGVASFMLSSMNSFLHGLACTQHYN